MILCIEQQRLVFCTIGGTGTIGFVGLEEIEKFRCFCAIGAKEIAVTFNKSVEEAELTFKRGNVTLTGDLTWNDAKTVATFENVTRLATAAYTVEVIVDEEVITETFGVVASKVDEIKILGDTLVMSPIVAPATVHTTGTIRYQVLNQYGEDVTNTVESNGLEFNVSRGSISNVNRTTGTVTVAHAEIKKDDIFVLSAVHPTTGVTTSAVLKASDAANIQDFKFTGVKMPKDVTVIYTVGSNGTNDFYFDFEAFNQYGSRVYGQGAITAGISTIVSSRPDVATVVWGTDATTGRATLEIVPGSQHGTTTFTTVSLATGKVAQFTVEVAEAKAPKTIALDIPATDLKKGEFVYIPYVAEDQYGNAVTRFETLEPALSLTVSPKSTNSDGDFVREGFEVEAEKNPVNGALRIKLTATSNAPATATVIAQVGTSVSQTSVNTVDRAEVARITGLSATTGPVFFERAAEENPSTTIAPANVVLNDQYGRNYTFASLVANDQRLVARVTGSTVTLDGTQELEVDEVGTGRYILDGSTSESISLTGKNVVGNSTLNFRVQEEVEVGEETVWVDTEIAFNITVGTVARASIVDFNVAQISKLYGDNTVIEAVLDGEGEVITPEVITNDGYGVTLDVYGLTSAGVKVALHASTYETEALSSKLNITGDVIKALDHKTGLDTTGSFVVTFDGANGPVVKTQTVTISAAAPKAESITVLAATEGVVVVGKNIVNGVDGASLNLTTTGGNNVRFRITDQYGKFIETPARYFVTNLTKGATNGSTVTVTSHAVVVTGALETGDSFVVTAVTENGLDAQVKIVVGN